MPSKREKIGIGEYCHIYNRGTDKRVIFKNSRDVKRFLDSMYMFNTVDPIISLNDKRKDIKIGVGPLDDPLVSIVAYSLLPNHFHILVKQISDGGISEFMKRLQCGYTSYFNIEHERSGNLFQGKYKYKYITNDSYLKTVFCYVTFNINIHDIGKNRLQLTRSSFDEYLSRKGEIISRQEMKFIYDVFGNDIDKIRNFSNETLKSIKEMRARKDYKSDKRLIE